METAQQNIHETQRTDEQIRYDLHTQFAELVDGNMRTEFTLRFDGKDLLGVDGWGMRGIAKKSLEDARYAAALHPELTDEVSRREIEGEEIEEAVAMAAGEGPNTMIVVSDFPSWLKDATEDIGGYNVTRKQTMLRVITRELDGSIKMVSRSLDGSNREALESIYAEFGLAPEEGELLGQRIHVDLNSKEQENLDSRLTGIYDASLTEQFGGEWYAGRQPADYRNTYDFVVRQHDLIAVCLDLQKRNRLDNKIMYDIAATMQKRFEQDKISIPNLAPKLQSHNTTMVYREIMAAGEAARAEGMKFSACGVTLGSEGIDGSTSQLMNLSGYGNKSIEETGKCEFKSKKCPECQKANVKTVSEVKNGKRHVSGSCGCKKVYPL